MIDAWLSASEITASSSVSSASKSAALASKQDEKTDRVVGAQEPGELLLEPSR